LRMERIGIGIKKGGRGLRLRIWKEGAVKVEHVVMLLDVQSMI
jgi:hypothetical protein